MKQKKLTTDAQVIKGIKEWVDSYFLRPYRRALLNWLVDAESSVERAKSTLKDYQHWDECRCGSLEEIVLAKFLVEFIEKGYIAVDSEAVQRIANTFFGRPQLVMPIIESIVAVDSERVARENPKRGFLDV